MLAPAALASPASLTVKAPYKHAVVQPYSTVYGAGCYKEKTSKKWGFDTKTGVGGVDADAKAFPCKNPQFGYGTYGTTQNYGQIYVGIPFDVATGATTVQANVDVSWAASITASDGGKAACGNYYNYDDRYTSSEWGYISTPFGSGYTYDNYSYADRTSQPWGTMYNNGTGGNAVPPAPYHENSTSYFYYWHSWGGSASCYSYADAYMYTSSYMYDLTNGSYIPQSATTVGHYGDLFDIYVETSNYTNWECYNGTLWNGPSASWSNTTLTCYNYNSTVTSAWYDYIPTYTYGTSANNSVTETNISSVAGSWYWNYSFNSAHHFELIFYFYGGIYAYTDWPKPGYASAVLNMATGGNGFKLASITSS